MVTWQYSCNRLHGSVMVVVTFTKEVLLSWSFVYLFVRFSVCLIAGLNKYYWLELVEKKSDDRSCSNFDPVKYWDWSGSASGWQNKKIRIFPFTYYYVPWRMPVLSDCSSITLNKHLCFGHWVGWPQQIPNPNPKFQHSWHIVRAFKLCRD